MRGKREKEVKHGHGTLYHGHPCPSLTFLRGAGFTLGIARLSLYRRANDREGVGRGARVSARSRC